jgi:hypothetical protein
VISIALAEVVEFVLKLLLAGAKTWYAPFYFLLRWKVETHVNFSSDSAKCK